MHLAPLEHKLSVPLGYERAKAAAILEGRYELPRVPDMPKVHRILDIGAEIGAFAAWSFYLWPHAWIDCYERNEERAAYCKQNAPPGTKVHGINVNSDDIATMPKAEVVRVRGEMFSAFFAHYPFIDGVRLLVHEWSDENQRAFNVQGTTWRLVTSRVDHLGRGIDVWMRTCAIFDPKSDTHFVIGDEPSPRVTAHDADPKFALGITHTPWIEARVTSMRLLLSALSGAERDGNVVDRRIFADREPNHSWSGKMWAWAADVDATHALFLQDDVWPAPNFWSVLSAMVKAAPHEIIGLEAVHPAIRFLAQRGERWGSTRAWLIGPGYVFPRAELRALLAWRAQQPRARILATNEDTLINDFCAETGRRVLHPIPTIIDHDTSIPSTYDNDADGYRKPVVKWDDGVRYGFKLEELADPSFWAERNVTNLAIPKEAK